MVNSPLHSTTLHTASIVKHKLNATVVLTLFTFFIALWLNWRFALRFSSYVIIAVLVVSLSTYVIDRTITLNFKFDHYAPSQDTLFTALLVVLLTPLTLSYGVFVLALLLAVSLHVVFRRIYHTKFPDPALFSVFVVQTLWQQTFRIPETMEGFFAVFDVNVWRVLSGFYDGFLLSATSLVMMGFIAGYFLIARVLDRNILKHVIVHAFLYSLLLMILSNQTPLSLMESFGYGLPMLALIFIVAQYDTTPTDEALKALYALVLVSLYATLYLLWDPYAAIVVAILAAQTLAMVVEAFLKRPLLWTKTTPLVIASATYFLFVSVFFFLR